MRRLGLLAAVAPVIASASLGIGTAQGAAPGVQVTTLATFPSAGAPAAVAATNLGDAAAAAGSGIVRVGPQGQQRLLTTIQGGAFGGPIGVAYDAHHQLFAAVPESFGPPPQGTVLAVHPDGSTTPVPGSDGMIAPDGFGLDAATGTMYVTDIFGNAIWRFSSGGPAQMWTSLATDPLVVLPDGVKVLGNAVYVSAEAGKILRIPINADGTAGAASVWAQIAQPGVFFDDMVLDDRTGDVYVTRLDTNELLQITPSGTITTIADHADGLLGAANMVLFHVGRNTVIELANTNSDFLGTGATGGAGPAILKITIAGG